MIAASAALAVGGSLAVAASASAAQIPFGTPGVASTTSINGLLTTADNGLIQAENVIYGGNALAANHIGTAVDPNFTTAFSTASQLTSTNVPEIGTDVAASANTGQLELALCVFDVYPAATGDTSESDAVSACTAASSPYLASAASTFTGKLQPGVASAAASWPQLSEISSFLGSDNTGAFSNGLYSIDGDLAVSSTATVTAKGKPTAYGVQVGTTSSAPNGYVLPSAFTLSFPGDFQINTALASKEIQSSTEANPNSLRVARHGDDHLARRSRVWPQPHSDGAGHGLRGDDGRGQWPGLGHAAGPRAVIRLRHLPASARSPSRWRSR